MKAARSTDKENVETIAKPPKCGIGGSPSFIFEREPVLKAKRKKTGIKNEQITTEVKKITKYCHHSPVKITPQLAIVLAQPS